MRKWSKWLKGCVKLRWVPLKIRFKFRLIHMLVNLQRGNCMYRILWASRINSKPQSFAKCLLLSFYASTTCRVGLVAVKHFQVLTQRCIYVYFYIYFMYIYIHKLLALFSDVSTRLEHIYMFEIMWFESSWHRQGQMTEDFSSSCFLFPFSNFLLSDWAKALDCHFPSARNAADSFVRSPKLQQSEIMPIASGFPNL